MEQVWTVESGEGRLSEGEWRGEIYMRLVDQNIEVLTTTQNQKYTLASHSTNQKAPVKLET